MNLIRLHSGQYQVIINAIGTFIISISHSISIMVLKSWVKNTGLIQILIFEDSYQVLLHLFEYLVMILKI